jgi:hypothetical protein
MQGRMLGSCTRLRNPSSICREHRATDHHSGGAPINRSAGGNRQSSARRLAASLMNKPSHPRVVFQSLVKLIRRRLRALGYDVVPSGLRTSIAPISFPRQITSYGTQSSSDPWLCVPLESLLHYRGFSFDPSGWHPHRVTLEEYLAQPARPYEQTSLYRYHTRYWPNNLQEALLYRMDDRVEPLCWLPAAGPFRNPWNITRSQVRQGVHTGGSNHASLRAWKDTLVSMEASKFSAEHFLRLYYKIEADGYRPLRYDEQPVRGYFLSDGTEYRFVCGNGNHRLSVLAVLGIKEVLVKLAENHPAVVHKSQAYRWSRRCGGLYDDAIVEDLITHMMRLNGKEQAEYWDLEE